MKLDISQRKNLSPRKGFHRVLAICHPPCQGHWSPDVNSASSHLDLDHLITSTFCLLFNSKPLVKIPKMLVGAPGDGLKLKRK